MEKRADLLTRPQAAAYLGMGQSWLSRNQAAIPPIRIGRKVFYLRGDLDAYVEGRRAWGLKNEATFSITNLSSRAKGTEAPLDAMESEMLRRASAAFAARSKGSGRG